MKEQNITTEKPLVSIIITSYNYGCYLSYALESVLRQSYPNTEIVIVDDGSTDNTKSVAESYRVKYVFQERQGISVARNAGISLTHGEFIMCLDGDDKLAPEYIETTLKQMVKHSSTGFVYTGSVVWNEISKLENIWMPHRIYSKYSLFAGWHGALGPMIVRRNAFESLEYGYDRGFQSNEDLDLCFRLLSKGWKSDFVNGPLHWYRVHPGSLNPSTPERKKRAVAYMDLRFWFRRPYRMIYGVYQATLGRVELLMKHPIKYMRSIQEKIQLNIKTKWYCQTNVADKEQVRQIQREISLTLDMLVVWCRNKSLRKYYENRIKILESRLRNLVCTRS